MSKVVDLPTFGSAEFWAIYDEFCQPAHLGQFITVGGSTLGSQMGELMKIAHRSREIHKLTRPDHRWNRHMAWLTLRDAEIFNDSGIPVRTMRRGDIVIVEWQWDRDVIVTHTPISRHIRGYLLSGRWEEMVGLFMPLFKKETIMTCVALRVGMDASATIALAEEEAREWGWY